MPTPKALRLRVSAGGVKAARAIVPEPEPRSQPLKPTASERTAPNRGCPFRPAACSVSASSPPHGQACQAESLPLWPGVAPGDEGDLGPEHDSTPHDPKARPGTEVIRLANVSRPTITLCRAPAELATGAAVVVCPGGGYHILAWDLEGTEVCAWLNTIGVTGVLLKYRVPGRGAERYTAPLQDGQRALGLVRRHAGEWGIDPARVGILGFSAGAHLAAAASTNYAARTYPAVDAADAKSSRPDFTVLVYPAYLAAKGDPTRLAPEIRVSAETPPAFVVQTQDDANHVDSAFGYALALKQAGVPVELHVYPSGGHGYGLRPSGQVVCTWPQRVAEWLQAQGWLRR